MVGEKGSLMANQRTKHQIEEWKVGSRAQSKRDSCWLLRNRKRPDRSRQNRGPQAEPWVPVGPRYFRVHRRARAHPRESDVHRDAYDRDHDPERCDHARGDRHRQHGYVPAEGLPASAQPIHASEQRSCPLRRLESAESLQVGTSSAPLWGNDTPQIANWADTSFRLGIFGGQNPVKGHGRIRAGHNPRVGCL